MEGTEVAQLTHAIGKLEAATEALSKQLDQNHEDMKQLIATQRDLLNTHEERLDGFDKDRTRLYTIAGAIGLVASFLGVDRLLQWFGKS